MKKRFAEEQVIGILKEAETGMKAAGLCRKHGISEATYYVPQEIPLGTIGSRSSAG